jgi:predicted AlkP superfamily phosphohydrolase/phosphomutase
VFVHFLETDQVQHRYWIFMEGEQRFQADGPHRDAILRLFQECEKAMEQIITAAGDPMVCVMSDHGFGPMRHQVWLNNWLRHNGYLTLRSGPGVWLKQVIYRLGLSPASIREKLPERLKMSLLQFFERQKGRAIAEVSGEGESATRKNLVDWITERLAIDFHDVDWNQTQAFSTGTTAVGYVWLNVAGRDPQGIVQPDSNYLAVRREIAGKLEGWDAVGEVLMREAVWQGPEVVHAPDLVVRWAQGSTDARFFQTRFSSHHLMKAVPNDSACHRQDGMFVFSGQDVLAGKSVNADLMDLPPTLLWLLDLPVPDNMDGRVLTECFSMERPVETVAASIEERDNEIALSEEDEAAIMASLKGLGYIE